MTVNPPPIFIPHKMRLADVRLDADDNPTPISMSQAATQDSNNLKAIERWANDWGKLNGSSDKCYLNIPFKFSNSLDPEASFTNFKMIERWAAKVTNGECGCSCAPVDPLPAKCRLHIPHKTVLGDWERRHISFSTAQSREFDNYKAIERWAQAYAAGVCGCTCQVVPTDCEGTGEIAVWSMADEVTGISDGGSMSGWNDVSGFGRNWTVAGTGSPKWEASSGPGGGPAIRVGSESSDGYFVADAGVLTSLGTNQKAEAFWILKSASDSGNDGMWKFTSNGSDSHYHYTNLNRIYDSFANNTRVGPIDPGVTLTNWNLYGASQESGSRYMRLNGSSIYNSSSGSWSMSGGLLGQSDTFATKDMLMAEILMYNCVLSDASRALVHAYFADKYGLTIA